MPRSYDRFPNQRTNADHNPLAKLLQWQDATTQSATAAGQTISNAIGTGSSQAAEASTNSIGTFISQIWMNFQSLLNSFTGDIDTNVNDFNTALTNTFTSIDNTFIEMWDAWITALGGDLDAVGLSGVAQLLSGLAINTTSPMAPVVAAVQSNAQILAIINNNPVQNGLEQTVVSNGDYHQSTAVSPITTTASLGAIVTAGQAKTFGFLQWMGEYSATLTDFVVNFYRMNSSGDLVHVGTTSDIAAMVPGTMAWILDDITALTCAATDLIGVEFQVITSGTVIPWGFTAPPAGDHPTAANKMLGFSQNWAGVGASTILAANIGWTATAPYVGIGVGTPPPTAYFPVQTPYPTSGTHVPASWATILDLVGVGAAGGGEGETGAGNGDGGTAGGWAGARLLIGVTNTAHPGMDIHVGAGVAISVPNVGGSGGAYFTPGDDGDATVFTWVDMAGATQTLTCPGGLGGQPTTNVSSWGLSPGNFSYDGFPYTGGTINTIGGVGHPPGGGGTGGAAFQFGFAGAAGYAWAVDRQS